MAAKQTTTRVIVTRTKTPKSTKASSKKGTTTDVLSAGGLCNVSTHDN